ncbi:MAG: hypothetical protein AAFX54_09750 [Pseudomonadota bacterium]
MRLRTGIQGLKLFAFVLVALAQLIPSGFALTSGGDGISIVICTVDGEQSVSWEEYFGEAAPTQPPSDKSEHNPCHACVTSCRIGAAVDAEKAGYSHPAQQYFESHYAELIEASVPYRTSPPMPSRSPPVRAI